MALAGLLQLTKEIEAGKTLVVISGLRDLADKLAVIQLGESGLLAPENADLASRKVAAAPTAQATPAPLACLSGSHQNGPPDEFGRVVCVGCGTVTLFPKAL